MREVAENLSRATKSLANATVSLAIVAELQSEQPSREEDIKVGAASVLFALDNQKDAALRLASAHLRLNAALEGCLASARGGDEQKISAEEDFGATTEIQEEATDGTYPFH